MNKIQTESNSISSADIARVENKYYPVFPLPIFLLSGGVQRLRIFEQRYLSMIANANQTDGFVITIYQPQDAFFASDWGAHVQLVDFDQGKDGVLTVDVLATRLVKLAAFKKQKDGLTVAEATPYKHWSTIDMQKEYNNQPQQNHQPLVHRQLTELLKNILSAQNELSCLYKTQYFDYPQWVCARLLEILPIPLHEKEKCIQQLNFSQITNLISTICDKEINKLTLLERPRQKSK